MPTSTYQISISTVSATGEVTKEPFTVTTFAGTEGVSELYRFEIVFALNAGATDQAAKITGAIGASAELSITPAVGSSRTIARGMLASIELENAQKVTDDTGNFTFRAVLVPQLWQLTLSRHSRVFVNQTIPQVIDSILKNYSFNKSPDNASSSKPNYSIVAGRQSPAPAFSVWPMVCQYRENDFDFLSRWMEREGLYFYFDHDAVNTAMEKLIITDQPGDAYGKLSEAPLKERRRIGATAVQVRDYAYQNPSLPILATNPASADATALKRGVHVDGVGLVSTTTTASIAAASSSNGPTPSSPPSQSTAISINQLSTFFAQVLSEADRAQTRVFHGKSGADLVVPRSGYKLPVEKQFPSSLNATYQVCGVTHALTIEDVPVTPATTPPTTVKTTFYRCDVTAIPASVQWRTPARTAWPRIQGTEHATIDGGGTSTYAQLDAYGRYLVWFFFDEEAQNRRASGAAWTASSSYVRMAQPHGGYNGGPDEGPQGFHFPLRAGTEVVCTFEGGDPDRPVISGVVSNAVARSPVVESNEKLNVIRTGGGNLIQLDDTAGAQQIRISTPHHKSFLQLGEPENSFHIISSTEGSKLDNVMGARTSTTLGASTSWVGLLSMSTVVGLATNFNIGASFRFTWPFAVDVVAGFSGGEWSALPNWAARQSYTFGGRYTKVSKDDVTEIGGNRRATVDGTSTVELKGAVGTTYRDGRTIDVVGTSTTTIMGASYTHVRPPPPPLPPHAGLVPPLPPLPPLDPFISTTIVHGDSKTVVNGYRETEAQSSMSTVLQDSSNFIHGNSFSSVDHDSTAFIHGLYRTHLNDRFEHIRGYKIEKIDKIAFKQAPLEVKKVGQFFDYGQNHKTVAQFSQKIAKLTSYAGDIFVIQ